MRPELSPFYTGSVRSMYSLLCSPKIPMRNAYGARGGRLKSHGSTSRSLVRYQRCFFALQTHSHYLVPPRKGSIGSIPILERQGGLLYLASYLLHPPHCRASLGTQQCHHHFFGVNLAEGDCVKMPDHVQSGDTQYGIRIPWKPRLSPTAGQLGPVQVRGGAWVFVWAGTARQLRRRGVLDNSNPSVVTVLSAKVHASILVRLYLKASD